MPISVDQVKHIARLSRIAVDAQQTQAFAHQLDRVLEYVNQLQQVKTDSVEPAFHVLPISNVLREDATGSSLTSDDVAKMAPDRHGPFIRVPLVVEGAGG